MAVVSDVAVEQRGIAPRSFGMDIRALFDQQCCAFIGVACAGRHQKGAVAFGLFPVPTGANHGRRRGGFDSAAGQDARKRLQQVSRAACMGQIAPIQSMGLPGIGGESHVEQFEQMVLFALKSCELTNFEVIVFGCVEATQRLGPMLKLSHADVIVVDNRVAQSIEQLTFDQTVLGFTLKAHRWILHGKA